jgi:hypothetical protein
MKKVYRTIPTYPIIKVPGSKPSDAITIRGKLITEDEEIQKRIENAGSFKKGWITVDEEISKAADEGVSDSDINEVIDGADPDEVVPASPGKAYAMNDLLKMKVPELRGILQKLNVAYSGLNKQELIQSILKGKRVES